MYTSELEMNPYLKFVFPENISIEKQYESVVPKFFTFMSTDGDGVNSYFHCLIFHEQISKYDVLKETEQFCSKSYINRMRGKTFKEIQKNSRVSHSANVTSIKNLD